MSGTSMLAVELLGTVGCRMWPPRIRVVHPAHLMDAYLDRDLGSFKARSAVLSSLSAGSCSLWAVASWVFWFFFYCAKHFLPTCSIIAFLWDRITQASHRHK